MGSSMNSWKLGKMEGKGGDILLEATEYLLNQMETEISKEEYPELHDALTREMKEITAQREKSSPDALEILRSFFTSMRSPISKLQKKEGKGELVVDGIEYLLNQMEKEISKSEYPELHYAVHEEMQGITAQRENPSPDALEILRSFFTSMSSSMRNAYTTDLQKVEVILWDGVDTAWRATKTKEPDATEILMGFVSAVEDRFIELQYM